MTRVLVVDDEPQILKALTINLRSRGFDVDTASDGREALEYAAANHPDLVLLDLGLPKVDGLDVITGLRGWTTVPIIVLSVRETEADKVAALDNGADDYLTKPFGMNELLARIRAVTRRRTPTNEQPVIETPDFTIDLTERRATLAGGVEATHLTPTEWSILEALARHPGRLVTQRQLLDQVWGPHFEDSSGYVRVHLAHLRQKLEPEPSRPRYLLTEPGIGYRFEP
jgi:two-component system, OmpR family, KDP operon response regulator KdpE